jgi:hypothetical protein
MQKTSGQCHINKTRWLFLLFLLFLPENYQPATSRSPRKSWTADGSTNAKTAKHLAVLSLFLAVSVRKTRIAKATLPPQTGSARRAMKSV